MHRAFAEVWDAFETHKVDLRTAAYIVGVARVAEATITRGISAYERCAYSAPS